jgi:purine catabolism regulator
MLTLRHALQLPVLEKARVAAGAGGLDHVIRRLHVVDIPGADYREYGEGLLLFTAGYGIKDNPAEQAVFIDRLSQHGLIGLVFSLGWYFERVPEVMLAAANRLDFPILTVLYEVNFITIIERLYVELVNDQFALKERGDDIHRRLTELVLQGGTLADLAETLAGILERSVLIESLSFEVLASAQYGPVDENRLRALKAGRTPPELVARMTARGIYRELREKLRPIRLGVIPELGMAMPRIVAPIVAGRDLYGYIWIVAGDHPLADLDELAVDHAATVAALVLLKEQAVHEAQQALRGDFLTQLLAAGERDSLMSERAHQIGYQFDHPHQALFVLSTPAPEGARSQLAARVDRWRHGVGVWGLVVARERGLAVVLASKSEAQTLALAERLAAELSNPAQSLIVGVGRVAQTERHLRHSYDEARQAAEIAERLSLKPRAVSAASLGLLAWLYHLPPESLESNPYFNQIAALAAHDRDSHTDFVRTLEAYLEHGGALAEAAAALNVHRNTMLYRVGRLEALMKADLKDAVQRLNLYAALKAYLLRRPR